MPRIFAAIAISLLALCTVTIRAEERPPTDSVDTVIGLFQQRCTKCHGKNDKIEGEIDLSKLKSVDDLATQAELIRSVIEALDSEYMPPEDEPPLEAGQRAEVLARLEMILREVVATSKELPRTPIRRMNRFQYNNAVQDLFELKVVVFPLPERMLREHGNYFQPASGRMPPNLKAGSRMLGKSQLIEPRLAGVAPFPQDLRAEHGFDNQADHLTLSPMLLESFLKLSQSIVFSPDFQAKNSGNWNELFASPTTADAIDDDIRKRLQPFLTRAFRRPVDEQSLNRYSSFALAQIESGETFIDAMKRTTAAALASPRFFYLFDHATTDTVEPLTELDDFDLASRLSFFLWGSIPDDTLLELAADDQLHRPEVLAGQVDRLLNDYRTRRFCDSFPAQWLQLERIVSSTPDPERYPQFYFAKYRASMHMMLEPLLLFETVLVEDLSILQFIDSDFSYRSNLLQAWYRNGTQGNAGNPVVVNFQRVPITDRRQGGLITNAAVMTMTSGQSHTKPITRGAWIASVILNDPPPPPPADVPPLGEEPTAEEADLTLRERFAVHRQRADCAGCHRRLDPLGFALENFDAAGIWRDSYANGREVDPSGTLFGKYDFNNVVEFKDALLAEKDRFARALAGHLLAYATGREVSAADSLSLDSIVTETADADYRFRTLIKQVVLSDAFRR